MGVRERALPGLDNGYTKEREWNGFEAGGPVKITGVMGLFKFQAHVTNRAGSSWIDVYGPVGRNKRTPGTHQLRSFAPERARQPNKAELRAFTNRTDFGSEES